MNAELKFPPGYNLRLAKFEDDEFLFELFCSARPEIAQIPLPKPQLEGFMRQQYKWQQQGYTSQYPDARNWIIETHSGAAGKIMLFQSSDSTLFPIAHGASACVHIIDFVIAPEWRNRGLGSTVLAALKKYAAANSALLRLSVDRQNVQAKRLYVRHGFVERQVTDTHEQLFWAAINE